MARIPTIDSRASLPARSNAPRVDPGSFGLAGGTASRALNQLSAVVEQAAEAEKRARQVQQFNAADLAATRELTLLRETFQQDTDFASAPTRFTEQVGEIRERYLAGIEDATVRGQWQRSFETLALSAEVQVRNAARAKMVDAAKADLDAMSFDLAQAAAGAGDEADRQLYIDRGREAIGAAGSAGLITQQEVEKRLRALVAGVDEAEALQLINDSPVDAVTALGNGDAFSGLAPAKRERLYGTAVRRLEADLTRARLADERAARAAERAEREAAIAATVELLDLSRRNELTQEDIDARRDLFTSVDQYNVAVRALDEQDRRARGGPAFDDSKAFVEIQGLLRDGEWSRAYDLAEIMVSIGLLRTETLNSVRAVVTAREGAPDVPFDRFRRYVDLSLQPSDANPDPAARLRQQKALLEFDDFFAKNAGRFQGDPATASAELRTFADELVRKWAIIEWDETSLTLPFPSWFLGTRGEPDIYGTADRIREDFEAGRIDSAERIRRAIVWRQWQTLHERTRDARDSEGSKR